MVRIDVLSSPNAGEYFIDPATSNLYFMPPGAAPPSSPVIISVSPSVIHNTGANHTHFVDMVISDAQGDAVSISGAVNVTFSGGSVSNTGGACIRMVPCMDCTACGVTIRLR